MKDFRDVIWYLPPTHSLRFGELWYRINDGRVERRAPGDPQWTNSASFRHDKEKFLALQLPIVAAYGDREPIGSDMSMDAGL